MINLVGKRKKLKITFDHNQIINSLKKVQVIIRVQKT